MSKTTTFRVRHYDGSTTAHTKMDAARREAWKRLDGWKEKDDLFGTHRSQPDLEFVTVLTAWGEPTDAVSVILEVAS